MAKVTRVGRVLWPLALAFLLSMGACAMYDLEAFTEPDNLALADTEGASESAVPTPTPAGGPTVHTVTTQTVTLAWDPPASAVTGYRVYYRVHVSGAWMPLGDVEATASPEYEVDWDGVRNGDFDFAVSSLNGSEESDKDISYDETLPNEGWYLHWAKPE